MKIHVSLAVMVLLVVGLLHVDAHRSRRGPRKNKDQPPEEDGEEISEYPKEEIKEKPKKPDAEFKGRVQPDPSGQAQVKNGHKKKKFSRQPKKNPEEKAGPRRVRKNNNGKGNGSSKNNDKSIKNPNKQTRSKRDRGLLLDDEPVSVIIEGPYNGTGFPEIDDNEMNDNFRQEDQVTDFQDEDPNQGGEETDGQGDNPDPGADETDGQDDNPDPGADETDGQDDNPDPGADETDGQDDSPDQGDSDILLAE